jgi:ketosteroid isomerase-like protein
MSEENVELVRKTYAAYDAAVSAPKPREAIRAALERFADPEIEWELDPTVSIDQKAYHGIDDVVEWFEVLLEAFEQAGQVPERFIDCGDQVLVFIRGEWRGRTSGLEINEQWTHLHTLRNGKIVRMQMFRDREQALQAAGLRE